MSKEVDLSELDQVTIDDARQAMQLCNSGGVLISGIVAEAHVAQLLRDSRKLDKALTQIDALTAQVEELTRERNSAEEQSESLLEKMGPNCCACSFDNKTDVCMAHSPMLRKAEAELAALREGAKVTYRVERDRYPPNKSWVTRGYADTLAEVRAMLTDGDPQIVEITTHERILDTTGGEG